MLYFCVLCGISGALPFIDATFPSDNMFFPVLYDSPACDSLAYRSVLECPRAVKSCNHTCGSGGRSGHSGSADMRGILGKFTSSGRKDRIGFVGVKCEGEAGLTW